MGVTFFEIWAGGFFHNAKYLGKYLNTSEHVFQFEDAPNNLSEIIMKMLSKEPENRPTSEELYIVSEKWLVEYKKREKLVQM